MKNKATVRDTAEPVVLSPQGLPVPKLLIDKDPGMPIGITGIWFRELGFFFSRETKPPASSS